MPPGSPMPSVSRASRGDADERLDAVDDRRLEVQAARVEQPQRRGEPDAPIRAPELLVKDQGAGAMLHHRLPGRLMTGKGQVARNSAPAISSQRARRSSSAIAIGAGAMPLWRALTAGFGSFFVDRSREVTPDGKSWLDALKPNFKAP